VNVTKLRFPATEQMKYNVVVQIVATTYAGTVLYFPENWMSKSSDMLNP
jgi:hypothetical protein